MASNHSNVYALLLAPLFFMTISSASDVGGCTLIGPAQSSTPLVSFLERVQYDAYLTGDPKSFEPKMYVDLTLKQSLEATEAAFADLPRVHGIVPYFDMKNFVETYFGGAGSDLEQLEPTDFVSEPEDFLPNVKNPSVRMWALEVHSFWKNLSRGVSDDVKKHPERHTLLPLPELMIIPGSIFKEQYYWDSYWIIRGLLVSKMYDTAKSIVKNLVWMVDAYGHPLNGARVYYTNRSQPPLLSSMVLEIYSKTGDLEFVKKCFPSLLKEYSFWTSGVHKVMIRDLQGHVHSLSRYFAMWNSPRPESATTDKKSASKLKSSSEKEVFYHQLASAAESGWDFSSRWMSNFSDITTLSTSFIIPVDLNTYLYKVEYDLAIFAKILGDVKTSTRFQKALEARQFAMRSIFWNQEMNQWLDYWISSSHCEEVHQFDARSQNTKLYISNFIPIWIWRFTSGVDVDSSMVESILQSFQKSGLIQPAGIATSLFSTGQQWDYPNGWAPLQHMIIEGLSRSGSNAAKVLAEDIIVRWIRTNYVTYNTTRAMYERYGVEECGSIGGGDGIYKPQTGFGWSNGVLLALLEEFGWPLDREPGCN